MNQTIVITTINDPTESVRAYADLADYQLVVVGDKKTNDEWSCVGADFLPVIQQADVGPNLANRLPYNHYCRKMFGYLQAIHNGADVIIDTDDDNAPKLAWAFPKFDGAFEVVKDVGDFVNIYQWFTDARVWPRGLPLDLVTTNFDVANTDSEIECRVGVWQGLADEDPDVDAIYRLTNNTPCYFAQRSPLVLAEGAMCPFNSQNTATRRELFPLLYLPASVTFRFTDILRSLVAQPIMWLYGYRLGFTQATVIQKRNPHDFMKDFASEVPMYLKTRDVVEIVSSSISTSESLEANLHRAYAALLEQAVVGDDELHALEAWLCDVGRVG